MALFQTSVLKKYLSQQDQTAVEKTYHKFTLEQQMDAMVYELYGLSNEEIKIVKNA